VCHKNVPPDCLFGVLQPIYLPPHAVSIPRTEVPMEAIIGVQVRRKETLSRKFSAKYNQTTFSVALIIKVRKVGCSKQTVLGSIFNYKKMFNFSKFHRHRYHQNSHNM